MPRKQHPNRGRIFVPTDNFVASVEGVDVAFRCDLTRVREGHEILRRYPHLFREAEAHYEVEQATAAPGEVRA